jgi:anti-anti-sigma regulatory factor
MNYQEENQNIIIHFGKYLNLTSIEIQKNVLKEVLATNKPIVFEAREVSQVDTAGLQLLLSFTIAAAENNISWEWIEPSYTLIQCSNLLGVRELLHLPKK